MEAETGTVSLNPQMTASEAASEKDHLRLSRLLRVKVFDRLLRHESERGRQTTPDLPKWTRNLRGKFLLAVEGLEIGGDSKETALH